MTQKPFTNYVTLPLPVTNKSIPKSTIHLFKTIVPKITLLRAAMSRTPGRAAFKLLSCSTIKKNANWPNIIKWATSPWSCRRTFHFLWSLDIWGNDSFPAPTAASAAKGNLARGKISMAIKISMPPCFPSSTWFCFPWTTILSTSSRLIWWEVNYGH